MYGVKLWPLDENRAQGLQFQLRLDQLYFAVTFFIVTQDLGLTDNHDHAACDFKSASNP
jgi:hypothetical protein